MKCLPEGGLDGLPRHSMQLLTRLKTAADYHGCFGEPAERREGEQWAY